MPYEYEIVNLKESIDARNFWNNIDENEVTKSFKIRSKTKNDYNNEELIHHYNEELIDYEREIKNNKIIIENLRKENDRLKIFQNKLLKINNALVNFIKFKKYFE
tara:strand:- start:817 stop:1131 length:315 start_codon:yes stop_codon:yes gene_type:complete